MESMSDPQYSKMLKALEAIVTEKYISASSFERIKATLDVFPYELNRDQICHVVVIPGSKEEISEIMRYANSIKMPVFIRGSATHLGGNYRPHTPGIVIRTQRLDTIQLFEDYGYFECGAGCIVGPLVDQLAGLGFFVPMAPGSRRIATMGGLVSNNTSGHVIDASVGKPGDYVLGLEIVLPNGEVIETGTRGMRRPAGTDLTKFFVGGDGLLGIITKIRMRLVPQVKQSYGIAVYRENSALARGVQRMFLERRPAPYFMEFMDERSANFGFTHNKLEEPGGAVNLFVMIGSSEEEAASKVAKVLESLKAEKPVNAYRVEDKEVWHKMWSSREVIGSNLMQQTGGQLSAAEIVTNLKDLVTCMEDCVHFRDGMPLLSQLDMHLLGHIGGLTFHPAVMIPREWDSKRKRQVADERFMRETELNLKYGTCGGEWGQFGKRKDFFVKRYGENAYQIVVNLKKMFDSNNILNPGILEGYR